MAIFKIKLEDKAAFLNRMEKADVELDSTQIVDNKLEGYFEVTIDEPKQLEVATSILKQSPKINDEATLEESPAAEILSILAGVAGLGLGSAAILKAQDMLKAKKPELYKKLQGISGAISAADPSKNI